MSQLVVGKEPSRNPTEQRNQKAPRLLMAINRACSVLALHALFGACLSSFLELRELSGKRKSEEHVVVWVCMSYLESPCMS